MVDRLALSVVIPTFNRRTRLTRVLDALQRQTVSHELFEVVVVDDGSTDGTSEALAHELRPFLVQPIRQANSGPARARNAGVAGARGELVLFLDDDVEPLPRLIEEHMTAHAAQPRTVVLGPLLSLPHYSQPWVAWEQRQLERQYEAMVRGDWEPTFRQFWTGNASVNRQEILDVGGFNPELLRGEDVELGYRLFERGLKFRFFPGAGGLHNAERSLKSWEHAHRSYGRLEVDVFGRMGERELFATLGGNWSRLHPGTRWMIRSCTGKPERVDSVAKVLRRGILLGKIAPKSRPTHVACSLLANLLYWDACLKELGPGRSERLLASAGTMH